jgi:cell division septation protein DedD
MKRVSSSQALLLYGLILGFVFVTFVLGLLIGTSGVQRPPFQPPVQSYPPVKDAETQIDFYEELSKPSEEVQSDEPVVILQQGRELEETVSTSTEREVESRPERPIPENRGEIFTIQVAAHSNLVDAQQLLIRLGAKGFEGRVDEPEPGSGDQYFRVWVGEFSSVADAEVVAAQLREESFHTYIRRIN